MKELEKKYKDLSICDDPNLSREKRKEIQDIVFNYILESEPAQVTKQTLHNAYNIGWRPDRFLNGKWAMSFNKHD